MHNNKKIAVWLLICCFFILTMVAIGGVTRLTGSGLSITEWKPVTGFIPPLNEQDWITEFESYKQSPEYKQINYDFKLDNFKSIFWLEFIHRLIGRITGFVFLLPLIYFAVRSEIDKKLWLKLGGIFILGTAQGFIGWYMVKSGLRDAPYVSQYWLAFHLSAAVIIFSLIWLLALGKLNITRYNNSQLSSFARLITAAIFIQIILGAFVAGLDAGLAYNSFPDMNGQMIPSGLFMIDPWYKNFFDNVTTVQFNHRVMAYVVSILIIGFKFYTYKHKISPPLNNAINIMLLLLIIQFSLGVFTLLKSVPVPLASAHQIVAVLLFASSLFVSYSICKK